MLFGIHWVDIAIILLYFLITLYLGIYKGGKKTKNLGDYFVAGGKWGAVVSFIFVFTSAVAGNEAVVVSGQAYEGGLSGVWYWWSFLFATPIYYLYSTFFKRARVYNISEMLEMRYDKNVSALYSFVSGVIGILWIGMFLLAVGKILNGMTDFSVLTCILGITIIVVSYVYTGGLMSTLLTDIFQGVLVMVFLCFIMLPFLWNEAGGFSALRDFSQQNPKLWDLIDPATMSISTIIALNLSAIVGGIATPWMYNYIAVSKNELAATQCGWGHLWKRVVTLLFALYGILFAIYKPGIPDAELSWGIVVNEILPFGARGLMIVGFLAAAMSSAGVFATSSSAVLSNYIYRCVLNPNKEDTHYLKIGRFTAVAAIVIAAISTVYINSIAEYVKLSMTFMAFVGIPLHFGIVWRKSNITGMWTSLTSGILSYILVVMVVMFKNEQSFFQAIGPSFELSVFISTFFATVGMIAGSKLGEKPCELKLNRFYLIMSTPIGQEQKLVEAGIKLPALIDAGLTLPGPEAINKEALNRFYEEGASEKIFGSSSNIELRKEKSLPWYYPGVLKITLACFLLVALTWLLTKVLFVW